VALLVNLPFESSTRCGMAYQSVLVPGDALLLVGIGV
jgi:hypothetical protein